MICELIILILVGLVSSQRAYLHHLGHEVVPKISQHRESLLSVHNNAFEMLPWIFFFDNNASYRKKGDILKLNMTSRCFNYI